MNIVRKMRVVSRVGDSEGEMVEVDGTVTVKERMMDRDRGTVPVD